MPPAVTLDHLTKSFGSLTAVDDIDLSIRPGEVVAFLGPNGAGKTTTIDMILGLSRPDEGSVEIFGMPSRRAVSLGLVSSVMQTGGLLDDLTVRETVEYTAAVFASSLDVDVVLERAGIADIAHWVVKKCSGGQKQKLRFAMALLPDPALIVLDEPTTGMDVTASGFLARDARRRTAREDDSLRHPLPRRGRRIRRQSHPRLRRSHRRRWSRP